MPSPRAIQALKAEQACLESAIVQLKHLAGPDLADFSRLTPRDIRSFTRALQAFWRNYAKTVRDAPNMGDACGLEIDLFELRRFQRIFQSRKEGAVGPISGLRIRSCLAVWHAHTGADRAVVGARMLWLQNWREASMGPGKRQSKKKVPPLPDYPERYSLPAVQTSLEYLRTHLQPQHRWIVNWEHVLSYEDAQFVVMIEQLVHLRKEWNVQIVDIMDFVSANGLSKPPKVGMFTTVPTQQQCEEKLRERCDICDFKLGVWGEESDEMPARECGMTANLSKGLGGGKDNSSSSSPNPDIDPEATELPVTTKCGHILGTDCLQSWVDTGHSTCPTCRTALYTPELCLPAMIRPHYRACTDMLDTIEKMDAKIDRHLLAGPKVVHDQQFLNLLSKMERTSLVGLGTLEKMMETVQIEASMLDAQPQSPTNPTDAQAGDVLGNVMGDGLGNIPANPTTHTLMDLILDPLGPSDDLRAALHAGGEALAQLQDAPVSLENLMAALDASRQVTAHLLQNALAVPAPPGSDQQNNDEDGSVDAMEGVDSDGAADGHLEDMPELEEAPDEVL